MQVTLARDDSTPTTGPKVTSWVLKAQPAPVLVTMRTVPLLVFVEIYDANHVTAYMKPRDVVTALKSLNATRQVVPYQIGATSASVILEDFEWRRRNKCKDSSQGWNGTFLALLKEFN